ncbi:MAG: hypothetical protein ACRDXC_03515, partial [Acidimicrobiales bacterium]
MVEPIGSTSSVTGVRPERKVAVGRRVFLGMAALGAAGIVLGSTVQSGVARALGSGIGSLLPGGDHWVIYSVSGSFPSISRSAYRLAISGLVERPVTLTLDDIEG